MDTYTLKDGRQVSVDFTDVKSLLAVSKEDMVEISDILKQAKQVVNSKIYDVNFLRSVGAIPTKEDYIKAQEVIAAYNAAEKVIVEEKIKFVKEDLKEFFKNTYIKKFDCFLSESYSGNYCIELVFIDPNFDEDYDGKFDNDIEAIGKKHQVEIELEGGIYGK